MTKIKLADGTILICDSVELIHGVLKINTKEKSVEELATIFSDKSKTNNIIFLTESDKESGYKTGFTSFAGITYNPDGAKVIELFQPADVTEARISQAEGKANTSVATVERAVETADMATLEAKNASTKADTVQANLDSAVTELTMALAATTTQDNVQNGGAENV